MYLLWLAGQRRIPSTISITADTGGELDMLWSTGRRSTAKEFFKEVTFPLAQELGLKAVFVRSRNKNGKPLPPIEEAHLSGGFLDIPLFGDEGGRLMQSCTQKFKVAAIRQAARRRGATSMNSAIGLTMDEVRRMKVSDVKWHTHYYPYIYELKLYRSEILEQLNKLGIPYLVTSQCDVCPHNDQFRWSNHTPETIARATSFEHYFMGDGLYLTQYRIPLDQALKKMDKLDQPSLFGCPEGGYCGVG